MRELADGGVWDTLAGQPTDDSEMALALARSLIKNGEFSLNDIRAAYVRWYESGPFDIGHTTRCGLTGRPMRESQGNGALMRISPLGIFGWQSTPEELAKLAAADAALTHPNTICQQVSGLYAAAIAAAVREGHGPQTLYERIIGWAIAWNVDPAIAERIKLAQTHRPPQYSRQMGWVLIAFHNALYELLHAPTLEQGVIETVRCGGDTDTNGAICGALLGAIYGRGPYRDSGWRKSSRAGPAPRAQDDPGRRNTGRTMPSGWLSSWLKQERREHRDRTSRASGSVDSSSSTSGVRLIPLPVYVEIETETALDSHCI